MTPRTVTSYGLVAGVSYTETRSLSPGLLCDLYLMRQKYDDAMHGIKRKKNDAGTAGIK